VLPEPPSSADDNDNKPDGDSDHSCGNRKRAPPSLKCRPNPPATPTTTTTSPTATACGNRKDSRPVVVHRSGDIEITNHDKRQ